MMSFRNDKLTKMRWPNETLRLVGQIQEFKGKQDLFKQQLPEILEALRDAAVIQSTESSNRLEGIVINTNRLSSICTEKGTTAKPIRVRSGWLSRCFSHSSCICGIYEPEARAHSPNGPGPYAVCR